MNEAIFWFFIGAFCGITVVAVMTILRIKRKEEEAQRNQDWFEG